MKSRTFRRTFALFAEKQITEALRNKQAMHHSLPMTLITPLVLISIVSTAELVWQTPLGRT